LKPGATLTRRAIERLIPHQGLMCLLAGAAAWDEQTIVCHADNHRDVDHPLRTRRGLLSTCLVEYAAQAMALHGALQATPKSARRPGMLAAARQLDFAMLTLDTLPRTTPDHLRIEARCDARDDRQLRYAFTAHHGDAQLASGRITVVLDAPPGAP
jgi:predicted hotdog family 3-hydroxylacyl-ACP dehydratase